MTKRGLLVVFSGPSGVGKDTVLGAFLEKNPGCRLSVSATTRPPRPGEEDGVDYRFISRDRFLQMAASGEMLEYAEYGGNLYGTPRAEVETLLEQGLTVILEIEVQGAMQIREKCPQALFVFLFPPSWDALRQRLSGRGTESRESLDRRLAAAKHEMSQAGRYDYVIISHSVEESCDKLRAVLVAESCKASKLEQEIEEVCKDA